MKASIFVVDIFKRFPALVTTSTLLLFLANLIDAASIFSLVGVVDLFINPTLEGASPITKQIIKILSGIGFPVSLGWILALFLAFNVLRVCFQVFAQNWILKTKYAMLREIMLGTFDSFFTARWQFFINNKQGVLLNTFMREMQVLGDAFSAMGRYFSYLLQIVLYLLVPFYISWQVTGISIVAALLFAIPFFLLGRVSYRLGQLNTDTANKIGSVIQESLNLAKLVLGFGNQGKSSRRLADVFNRHRIAAIKSQTLTFAVPLMYYPFGLLVLIIGLFVARRLTLPLSETVVLFYALMRAIPVMGHLTGEKSRLDNFYPSYEQIMNLRNRAHGLKRLSGQREFKGFQKEMLIKGVSFGYSGHPLILTDINIRIPKGKMVAIVGGSGVGKSTIIDMIMGFNQPSKGQITFDGVPLEELEIDSYRQRIGYVPQDSVLFNMSIRDNLLWVNAGVSIEEIQRACQQANAEEFIKGFSGGYDTIVGDRGVRLSGGQVQRIALARAILRKPELLVLDEATSSLDTYSERLIQQAIESIAKETTVVVVAHRLSTIINAEYIYVLKNGKIVEEGRYLELMKKNGLFNNMAQMQSTAVG